jgi:hypothetical protein
MYGMAAGAHQSLYKVVVLYAKWKFKNFALLLPYVR